MIECLTQIDLVQFLLVTGVEWTQVVEPVKAVIVHATDGDVTWTWYDKQMMFCWR
jgi:hypothetical protein